MATRIRTKAVVIEGVEKRTNPTKHYVYILRVEMNDESTIHIGRRYIDFLKLQTTLCSLFPKESGCVNKAERILPFIPGKAASGKNHLSCTAMERIAHLEEFCMRLVQMPDNISQCHPVKDFFSRKQTDDRIHSESVMKTNKNFSPRSKISGTENRFRPLPPVPPKTSLTYVARETFIPDEKYSKSQIPLNKGETVEVIEKLDIGWWFVEAGHGQGWVPASFLEDPTGSYEDDTKVYADHGLTRGKPYVVAKTYCATEPDELSLRRGTTVSVLEKKSDGWWLAEVDEVRGMVPGCCLARQNAAKGIRVVNESEAVPFVDQSPNTRTHLTTINESSCETAKAKPQPVPKPRRFVVSSETSPVQAPLSSPLLTSECPTPRQSNDSQKPSAKKESSMESSSDEDETCSGLNMSPPPPPREASFGPTKHTALPEKETPKMERKVYRVCQEYEAVALGTVSLKRGQEIQVMPRPDNNGWLEVKVDGKQGYAPKECIVETKKPPPRKAKGKQKCDLQDIEDAYWSGDALEGERVLHSINKAGTFMIRKSKSSEDRETLLVYESAGRILKYKIKQKQGSGYTLSKSSPSFESFEELIFFYGSNFLPQTAAKLQCPYQRVIGKEDREIHAQYCT